MNGKKNNSKFYKKKPKLRINNLDFTRKKDEQAATLESSNKFVGTFKRISSDSKLARIRQNKNVLKPVMLAVISALIIGSLFGVILLRMFVTMDGSPELGNNPNPAAVTAEEPAEENNEDTSVQDTNTVEFEPITANVLQGGIFSENENASAWALNFEELDIPVMIWNRDDQYYLFAGVKSSGEEASQAAAELETGELEIYSKEWSTPPLEISLNANEEEWLKSYLSWWNEALSSSEDTTTQLEQLKESIPDGNERLKPLYDELIDVNEINEKILLELWHVYDSLND
jgi:stage II sporulation protein B